MSGRTQELEAGTIDLSGRGATICLVLARAGADVAVNYQTWAVVMKVGRRTRGSAATSSRRGY